MKRTYLEYYNELTNLDKEYKREHHVSTIFLYMSFIGGISSIIAVFASHWLFIFPFILCFYYVGGNAKRYINIKEKYKTNSKALSYFLFRYKAYILEEAEFGRRRYYETDEEKLIRLEKERRERQRKREQERGRARQSSRQQSQWYNTWDESDDIFNQFDDMFNEETGDFYSNYRKQKQQYHRNKGGNSNHYGEYEKKKQSNTNSRATGIPLVDAYKLFRLSSSDDFIVIKKKYRELAVKYHPDKWANESKSKQDAAERNFKKLNNAYGLIKKDKGIK